MKLNADVREVPWKKVLVVLAILLVVAAAVAAFKKSTPKRASRISATEGKELVDEYLKEKSGRKQFTTGVDLTKDKNPWPTLKKAYDAPPDYETVYRCIGEHLLVADKMINGEDKRQQALGFRMVGELADEIAIDVAVDPWLAGRICDAYLMANLSKVEENPKNGPSREQMMHFIGRIYRKAGEDDRLIELGRKYLAEAASDRRSDEVRLRLAKVLIGKGESEKKEALQLLREIQHPALTNEATQRLEQWEQKGGAIVKK